MFPTPTFMFGFCTRCVSEFGCWSHVDAPGRQLIGESVSLCIFGACFEFGPLKKHAEFCYWFGRGANTHSLLQISVVDENRFFFLRGRDVCPAD
jgi:hypothetical protein